jgi:hypothetical protein
MFVSEEIHRGSSRIVVAVSAALTAVAERGSEMVERRPTSPRAESQRAENELADPESERQAAQKPVSQATPAKTETAASQSVAREAPGAEPDGEETTPTSDTAAADSADDEHAGVTDATDDGAESEAPDSTGRPTPAYGEGEIIFDPIRGPWTLTAPGTTSAAGSADADDPATDADAPSSDDEPAPTADSVMPSPAAREVIGVTYPAGVEPIRQPELFASAGSSPESTEGDTAGDEPEPDDDSVADPEPDWGWPVPAVDDDAADRADGDAGEDSLDVIDLPGSTTAEAAESPLTGDSIAAQRTFQQDLAAQAELTRTVFPRDLLSVVSADASPDAEEMPDSVDPYPEPPEDDSEPSYDPPADDAEDGPVESGTIVVGSGGDTSSWTVVWSDDSDDSVVVNDAGGDEPPEEDADDTTD